MKKLKQLELTGKYVFHGSARGNMETLEPRQGTHAADLSKPGIPDGKAAVSTTPYAEFAVFRALINHTNVTIHHNSRFGFNQEKKKEFIVSSPEVLESIKDKRGYVYVLNKTEFEPYSRDGQAHEGSMEWRAYTKVSPIDVIEVNYSDLPLGQVEISG